MRTALLAALVLLGIAACSANSSSGVHLLHARAPGASCQFTDDTVYLSRTTLDLGQVTSYPLFVSWENTLEPSTIVVGTDTLQDPTWHTFYAQEAEYSYKASNPAVVLPTTKSSLSASIVAGATSGTSDVGVELFPSPVGDLLAQAIPVGTSTPVTVEVTFRINGQVGGSSSSTNWFSFPVDVVNSGIHLCGACGADGGLNAGGACGNGFNSVACQVTKTGTCP